LYLLVGGNRLSEAVARAVAWLGFFLPAAAALYAWVVASGVAGGPSAYLFYCDYNTGLSRFGISLSLGLNGISLPMFVLAGTVGLAAGIYAIYSNGKTPTSACCCSWCPA
jgi:NADH-quinone oxidoreductase subunit M